MVSCALSAASMAVPPSAHGHRLPASCQQGIVSTRELTRGFSRRHILFYLDLRHIMIHNIAAT